MGIYTGIAFDRVEINSGVARLDSIRGTQIALTGEVIDLRAATVFTKTVTSDVDFALVNVPEAGTVVQFILDITNGGSADVLWWGNVTWTGGVEPALQVSGRDVLSFYSYDGGANWLAWVVATVAA